MDGAHFDIFSVAAMSFTFYFIMSPQSGSEDVLLLPWTYVCHQIVSSS